MDDKMHARRLGRRDFLKVAGLTGISLSGARLLAACAPAPTAAPTAMAGTSQIGGSLTATYMASGTYDAAAKDLIAAFEAKYGTKVTVAAFPWMGLVGNNAKDLITGAGNYDVMSGAGANLWAFLEPLDPYIQRDGYEEPFVPRLLDKMPHFQGALLGLPYGCDSYGMAIRTDLFEEAGIKVPQEAWTWDEFDKNVAELHAKFKDRG